MKFSTSKEDFLMPPEGSVKKEGDRGYENVGSFAESEQGLYEQIGEFLGQLAPEKYKKRATALLTTFSMFFPAASAFAAEKQGEAVGERVVAEDSLLLNQPLQSQSVISRVENVVVEKLQAVSEIAPEKNKQPVASVDTRNLFLNRTGPGVEYGFGDNTLLHGFSSDQVAQVVNSTYNKALRNSSGVNNFFSRFQGYGERLDFSKKMLVLQALGSDLARTYDYDMLARGEHVTVSDDAFFQALKGMANGEEMKTGMCANIHTFMARVGHEMGLETWLESGFYNGGPHVFMGTVGEIDGKKQIIFINYNTIIPTGTLNYEDALGIWERHTERVSTFGSYVANTDEMLFPVESRAGKVVQKAMGYEATDARLRKKLGEEREPAQTKNLDIQMSPETTEMQIGPDTIGLVFLSYKDLDKNPNQPLDSLQALRIPLMRPQGTPLSFEEDITFLHTNLKNMYGGTVLRDMLALRLAGDYVNTLNLTKGEYGNFLMRYGLTIQGAATTALDEMMNVDARIEAGAGVRIMYINPEETGTFYVGADILERLQFNNLQDQKLVLKKASETFTLGGRTQVQRGQFLDFEASLSKKDYGNEFTISGGLDISKIVKLRALYGKTISNYERFVPSSEEINAGLDFTFPIGEINILGFTKTEKYAGDNSQNTHGVDVKMRIVF